MLSDITIIIWKEWKELLRFQSGSRSGISGLLIMIAVFGILMPIQFGTMWVESASPILLWSVVPLILIGTIVADSIAGERERHTLETLLASRLPDQAILLGKIGAIVSFVWLITQLVFAAALVPVNILHGDGKFLFYLPEVLLGGLIFSLLLSGLMSSIGVLVSLRAASVKQAQQTLGLSVFLLAYAVPMAGIYGLRFLPEDIRNAILQPLLSGEIGLIILYASGLLVVLNLVFYYLASAHFRRTQLIFTE